MPTNRVPLVCTPEEFVAAVCLVTSLSQWPQSEVAAIPAVAALFRPAEEPAPAVAPPEPRYPCDRCGMLRTKAEGGTAFTVCDDCWDAPAPPPAGEPSALTHDRESLRQAWNDAENENERLSAEVAALRAENERLKEAIRWALGEGDSDFGDMMPPMGKAPPYWWRTHLRRKAGLVPPGENRSEG